MTALTLEAKLLERLEAQALEIANLKAQLVLMDEQLGKLATPPDSAKSWIAVKVELPMELSFTDTWRMRQAAAAKLAPEILPYLVTRYDAAHPLAVMAQLIVHVP